MSATNPPSDSTRTSGPPPNPGPSLQAPCPQATWSEPTTEREPLDVWRPARRVRLDPTGATPVETRLRTALLWAALAGGFVLVGGGNLDPSAVDARLGLAAGEGPGPLGQVYGGWDPTLWPAQVLTSQFWAWAHGGQPTTAAIRWPAAVAGLLLGLVLSLRSGALLGRRAALLTALCLFGSIAWMHRTLGVGLDLVLGLAVVGALDRILSRGSDWIAGLWAALAVLAGGWPPLLMILLPIVVLGRAGRTLSHRLLLPPLAAFAAWSVWTVQVASVEAWAAALTLPLMEPPAWRLILSVLGLGLPWAPLAVLAAWPSVRDGWPAPARAVVLGWLQVAGVALLAGTLIPGLAVPARVTAIAALAVVAAAGLDRALSDGLTRAARGVFLGIILVLALAWALVAMAIGGYLATAVSYYRPVSIVLVLAAYAVGVAAFVAACRGRIRLAFGAAVVVAICLKVAHWGVYVPEWNYRLGQGPWGRAIGQWVLPNRPIYTFVSWPHDLMFHTEHPVRQLTRPEALKHKDLETPQYVLLLEAEYDHWPRSAPALVKIREFQDQTGRVRVLARTEGDLGIRPDAPRWE